MQSPLLSSRRVRAVLAILLLLAIVGAGGVITQAAALQPATTVLWSPVEWSVSNPTYSGNPFDVIASVTFTHPASGETRTTQMFYAGDNTWKWRFTGTRTGDWQFSSQSSDPELNGITGAVRVDPNPDPNARGFVVTSVNKFARMTGDGQVEGHLFNVYMNLRSPFADQQLWFFEDINLFNRLLDDAQSYGFETVFVHINNNWFQLGALRHDQHSSQNPDLRTFAILDNLIEAAQQRGMNLYFWAWGDEDRRWTPIGVGGINGAPDQRLQRYIAARLGPLPGWSMGYGFDLVEWVSREQVNAWASNLNNLMGWPHLLFGRGMDAPALSGTSYSTNGAQYRDIKTSPPGPIDYADVLDDLNSGDTSRPHFYEERFTYMRSLNGGEPWSMDRTRRSLWWYALAGGVGSFWGYFPDSPYPYPNPEQLVTFNRFWRGRFLLDMQPANNLTDGYALRSTGSPNYVFYRMSAGSVRMDLSGAPGGLRAVAVDTRAAYNEIDLGTLDPGVHNWQAPYSSDWAIAVGFASAPVQPPPTVAPPTVEPPTVEPPTVEPPTVEPPTAIPTENPPTDTAAVSGLVVNDEANAADWSIQPNAQPGARIYGDRDFIIGTLPPALIGSTQIVTANDSKSAMADPLVLFGITRDVTVYIAHDPRIRQLPAWLAGWTPVNAFIADSTGFQMPLYAQDFPAGAIGALGPNQPTSDNGVSMYAVFVVERAPAPETPAPTEEPATPEPPAPTLEPPTGPALLVEVNPAVAEAGAAVEVALRLSNVSGVYGVQTECRVDPAVLSGAGLLESESFNSGNGFIVDQGFGPDGAWLVAASRIQPNPALDGTAIAYTLRYVSAGMGSSDVTCAAVLVDRDGSDLPVEVVNARFSVSEPVPPTAPIEEPTAEPTEEPIIVPEPTEEPTAEPTEEPIITPEPTEEPTAEPTEEPIITPEPTEEPILVGTISGGAGYQNRAEEGGITVQLVNESGEVVAEGLTGADGGYRFDAIPAGSYTLLLSAPRHLSAQVALTLAEGEALNLTQIILPGGDTDGDGVINLLDAALVGANLGQIVPPAPDTVDITGDNQVSIRDLAIIGGNFGMEGPLEVAPEVVPGG